MCPLHVSSIINIAVVVVVVVLFVVHPSSDIVYHILHILYIALHTKCPPGFSHRELHM